MALLYLVPKLTIFRRPLQPQCSMHQSLFRAPNIAPILLQMFSKRLQNSQFLNWIFSKTCFHLGTLEVTKVGSFLIFWYYHHHIACHISKFWQCKSSFWSLPSSGGNCKHFLVITLPFFQLWYWPMATYNYHQKQVMESLNFLGGNSCWLIVDDDRRALQIGKQVRTFIYQPHSTQILHFYRWCVP